MGLQDLVARAFDVDGALAQCVDEFTPRSGQTAMANAVAATLESGGALVVEAGTGVGKTFAYLVPTLLSGERVLLSTATKTLQDQLFGRDIPRLVAALGMPVRAALLKGRSSYLCMLRLGDARHSEMAHKASVQRDLGRVEAWSQTTRAGDMAELTQLDERSPVIPLVTSTRDNCLGARCPQISNCHVNLARREAMAADVVVINHHLFFADLNIRESGVAELLPTVRAVVFDEAHQLNEIGVNFLGRQLTTHQLDNFGRDLALQGHKMVLAHTAWPDMLVELSRSVQALRALCGGSQATGRIAWEAEQPAGIAAQDWQAVVSDVHTALQHTDVVLRSMEDLSPELQALHERASRLMAELDVFSHAVQAGAVRWLEVGSSQVRLVQSPLDIADAMRSRVNSAETDGGNHKSWIFTSATLGHDAHMAHFVASCGLEGAQVLQVQSPFDYMAQAALYIPEHMPKPGDAGHSTAVARLVAQGAAALGGRTLVLTTTLRAMRDIAAALREHFGALSFMDVLLQGESPKRELTERFVRGAVAGNNGCILVGSASFWEGIDVPGDALQMVVIDKLPFAPPGDPVVEARSRQLEASGSNPFHHYHVPQAAIALKQGAGRLIRRETDRGMLVVCDVRLSQMAYGRRILAALPAMRRITSQDQFVQVLEGLFTRPSTTGH
ncbi:ATP-dependent DNA helicase [Rhodoferax sp. AJA081-3]|uniref:ATP-dependent DNA helicase n=1 Tax=Rhodoferax sp. AJA081-3 TaxID=2752316 RepID=UPI001ADF8146|nr:ATP-dependent DNA helicase [Rhodoferax sp. AJA081-3]QTN28633.1 ATP-dependent DNA helicase [Rhodoferax sp. AJA081-3]